MPQQQSEYTIDSKDTAPASDTLAGTWTAAAGSKFLYGSSGAATTQLQKGWWVYDDTNDEVRQVQRVDSDNAIVLESGFTNAQSADTLRRVAANGMRRFSVKAVGDITVIDSYGNSTTLLDTDTSNSEANWVPAGTGLINPYIIDHGANDADLKVVL